MSETRLRALARSAEDLVDLPDLAFLEDRGRDLRTRRRATAAAAALAVAVVGTVVVQDRLPRAEGPDEVDTPARPIVPYPGNQMHDLPAATYELTPSSVRGEPTALITLPTGWNSWEGPNRFDGQRPDDPTEGRYNEAPLGRATWYVGVVVVKVLAVATERCAEVDPDARRVKTAEQTVDAITRIPGYRLLGAPERVTAFGYPATHLVVRPTPAQVSCDHENDATTFFTSANGGVGLLPADVWVLEVDGVPLTVIKSTNGPVPAEYRAQLDTVVESIEFRTHPG